MPSVLTCAVITLCEHQPVSTVCAGMVKQQSQNFCVKNQQFSSVQPVQIDRIHMLLS